MTSPGPATGRNVLILLAFLGLFALAIPPFLEKGLTPEMLFGLLNHLGVGLVASVLVILLMQAVGGAPSKIESLAGLAASQEGEAWVANGDITRELERLLDQDAKLKQLGLDRVYPTRESAYADIAEEMRYAKTILILSGSLHSFWSIYRELLIQRDRDPSCQVKVFLLDPDSVHAKSRAELDSAFAGAGEVLAGYSATIRQVGAQLKSCRFIDFCPPAAIWLIDEAIFVTPYFFGMRGGQGLCLRVIPSPSGIFARLKHSFEALTAHGSGIAAR